MRTSLVIPSLLALALTLSMVAAPSAEAETRPPTPGGGAYIGGNDDPTAVAVDGAGLPGGGQAAGGGGAPNPCHWKLVIEDDFRFPVYADESTQEHSNTGRWLQYWCDGIGAVAVNGFFLIPEGGLVDPAALAADALASIDIGAPAIRTSPAADGRLYVQIPTWLWLDEGWWKPHQASASAGRVTSTVTAKPVNTTWTMGDGSSVTCVGSGRAWHPGLPDDATDCRHTYRHSSAATPDNTVHLEATVTFEVTWTSSLGPGGTLPAITRTSSVDAEVGEIQAIGTK